MSWSDVWNELFGSNDRDRSSRRTSPRAVRIVRAFNEEALVCREGDYVVAIEDRFDSESDQRMYRLEYQSTPDGTHAIAYCRHNPWGREGDPKAGESALEGHVSSNGLLCLARGAHTSTVEESSLDLEDTIRRARFWCTGFSVLKETGEFPDQ